MESNGTPTPLAMGRISVSEIATATLAQPCLAAPAQHQLSGVKTSTYNKKGSRGMTVGISCSTAVCAMSP